MIFSIALLVLSKDAHSHQHYLVYAMMILEEMVTKFVKEECVEEVVIGNVVIMLLLYADDVVLLANTDKIQFTSSFGHNRTKDVCT